MPKTAVVNPRRRRRRRKSNPKRSGGARRKNTGTMLAREPNRRRRRGRRHYYGAARRRRRNPSGGASLSSSRTSNGILGLGDLLHVVPSATAGIWGARWAVAQAGEFEDGEPGFKHALAIYLAASLGGTILRSAFGPAAGAYAAISALGYGGDLFLRRKFLKDNDWVKKNISTSLGGMDDDEAVNQYSYGRSYGHMGDASFVDAVGNQYVQTSQGWALAGNGDGQYVQDEQGNVYELSGFEASSPLGGFTSSSPLGAVRPSYESSFGYA